MAVYQYQCSGCHRYLEIEKSMADPHPTICKECGGELTRIFTPVAFAFRGGRPSKTEKLDPVPGYDAPDDYDQAYG